MAVFATCLSAQITQSFSDRPVQAFAEPVFEQRPEVSMFEPFGEGERRGEDIEFESEEEMERIETERHDFTQSTHKLAKQANFEKLRNSLRPLRRRLCPRWQQLDLWRNWQRLIDWWK